MINFSSLFTAAHARVRWHKERGIFAHKTYAEHFRIALRSEWRKALDPNNNTHNVPQGRPKVNVRRVTALVGKVMANVITKPGRKSRRVALKNPWSKPLGKSIDEFTDYATNLGWVVNSYDVYLAKNN